MGIGDRPVSTVGLTLVLALGLLCSPSAAQQANLDADPTPARGGPAPQGTATVTRGPYLQLGTSSGIVVRWRTDLATDSRVAYGSAPGSLAADEVLAGSTTEHEVELTGLTPNTRYYYAVGTSLEILAGGDTDHFFDTAPPIGTPKPTRVWVLGDSGLGNTNATEVRDAYYDFTDDVANGGADALATRISCG